MANIKITDLTAYGDPASTDVLPIVDVGADVTKKVSVADLLENAGPGTASAPGIAFDGDPDTGIYRPGADQVAISTNGTGRLLIDSDGDINIDGGSVFYDATNNRLGIGTTSPGSALEINAAAATSPFVAKVNTSEAARIDTLGRLLIGTSNARSNFNGNETAKVQLESGTFFDTCYSSVRYRNGPGVGGGLRLGRTRGTAANQNTIVSADDGIGIIEFSAADGNYLVRGASIAAEVDGTPGADDMPGRLVFSVTADGSATPTEAMRIKNSRIINIANTPVYADNAAAKTGGLVDGDVYRTSTGDLKIAYS